MAERSGQATDLYRVCLIQFTVLTAVERAKAGDCHGNQEWLGKQLLPLWPTIGREFARPATDIDHDDEISLLEAFLAASAKTEQFYREQTRLATEHAILDDNGDKLGTGAEFFKGVRAVKSAQGGKQADGVIASRIVLSVLPGAPKFTDAELKRRGEIEQQLDELRAKRPTPPTEEYWNQLEQLLLQLAELYNQAKS